MRSWRWLALGGSLALAPVSAAWGHGARIDYHLAPAVEIQARYDSGEPMAEAQVAVFAPEQPEQPWQTGMTDRAGRFSFVPGADRAGRWEVQVRQAGHGGVISIPLEGGNVAGDRDSAGANPPPSVLGKTQSSQSSARGYSPAQLGLMIALGLWGCIGTGLFFARRRPASPVPPVSHPHAHS